MTDEMLNEMFGQAHDVVKDQRERLHELLDGFLTGNPELIQLYAEEIARGMKPAARTMPAREGEEDVKWDAIANIIHYAEKLKGDAAAGDYRGAYDGYARLVNQCITCHQTQRTWGIFTEAEAEGSKEVQVDMTME